MCYDLRTSLLFYMVGMISAIFAIYTGFSNNNSGQLILGFLVLTYVQVQLGEAIIWRGIDTNSINLNKTGTDYLKYTLSMHIIGIAIGVLISVIIIEKRGLKIKDFIPLMIGVIVSMSVINFFYNSIDSTYPQNGKSDSECRNNDNRLEWKFSDNWWWYGISALISMSILVLYSSSMKSKFFIPFMFTITLVLSTMFFPKNIGSMWCFLSAITAPVIVLGNYFMM